MQIIGWMRQDKLFSYWLFVWVLFYLYHVTALNPKLFIQLALVYELALLGMLIYFKNSFTGIFMFLVEIVILKLVPLYLLRFTKTSRDDIYAGGALAVVYTFYLQYLSTHPFKVYNKGIQKIMRREF